MGGGFRIGRRGEQPHHLQFAREQAVLGEELHANVIEVHTTVDAGFDAGLGDDQRHRLLQEGADLGGDRHQLAAAAQDLDGRIGEDAKPRALDRVGGDVAFRKAVFAHAQQGEIVGRQPVEKGHRLGNLVGRQRRRIGPVGVHDGGDAAAHRGPVAHRDPHIGEDQCEAGHKSIPRRRLVDPIDMDLDQAFAPGARLAARERLAGETHQGAGRVALHGQDRVGDEADLVAALRHLGEGRIEQERHVVVDDLDHRQRPPISRIDRVAIHQPHVLGAGHARSGQVRVGVSGEGGQRRGVVKCQVLGGDPSQQGVDKSVGKPARSQGGNGADQLLARIGIASGHGCLLPPGGPCPGLPAC